MTEPRKKKKKRRTGRPLEEVPLQTLLKRVKKELRTRMDISLAARDGKSKKELD